MGFPLGLVSLGQRLRVAKQPLILRGRTIWTLDAHGYGRRFFVHADEKLTAFVELGPRFTQLQDDLLSIDVMPDTTHHSGVG